LGTILSASAVNDYEILIEVIPETILQGEFVTFRIHADLIGVDDSLLDYVSVRGYTAPNTAGMYVIYPDGTSTHYRNDLSPIIIQNGVPSEAMDYVDVTFGTTAPDKDDWDGPSLTEQLGLYIPDFSGFIYLTTGSVHWFDIYKEFTVTEDGNGEEWEGYTPGWWGTTASKLLGYQNGKPKISFAEYQAAVTCVYNTWSADLPWLPTDVQGAYDIFYTSPSVDPLANVKMHLLCHLLSLCQFPGDYSSITITGPLGTFTYTPAGWAAFLVMHYNMGHYDAVLYYADFLNNM